MGKRTEVEMQRLIGIKRIRNRARLEAAIRVDLMLNDLEDDFVSEFDRRVAAGEPHELQTYEQWVVDAVNQRIPALPVGVGAGTT
jgi:hypothetical protein